MILWQGLDKIEFLQSHENEDIYKKTFEILENYFNNEDEDNKLVPQTTTDQGQFQFAENVDLPQQGFQFWWKCPLSESHKNERAAIIGWVKDPLNVKDRKYLNEWVSSLFMQVPPEWERYRKIESMISWIRKWKAHGMRERLESMNATVTWKWKIQCECWKFPH